MIYDFLIDSYLSFFEHYMVIVWFLLLFIVPLFTIMGLVRFLFDNARGIKRLNNLIIDKFSWDMLSFESKLNKESTRQRIRRIINFIARNEELFNQYKD